MLPEDAEPISSGGFNLFAGPFYRRASPSSRSKST
jgi:hypothetical protein